MPATKDKVMEMVEKALKKNPDVSNDELFEKAAEIDSSIKKLTLRQFHARYPLQVKRRMGAGKKKKKKKKKAKRAGAGAGAGGDGKARQALRDVLLEFAKEVAAADKAGMIDVLGKVDAYVDDALKAADR